jgi:hypothetical protein
LRSFLRLSLEDFTPLHLGFANASVLLQKVSGLQGSGLLQWIDRTSPYKKEKGMSEGGAVQVREEARKGYFDRFAQRCAEVASKAPFFTFCVALVVVWAPTIYPLYGLRHLAALDQHPLVFSETQSVGSYFFES